MADGNHKPSAHGQKSKIKSITAVYLRHGEYQLIDFSGSVSHSTDIGFKFNGHPEIGKLRWRMLNQYILFVEVNTLSEAFYTFAIYKNMKHEAGSLLVY